MKTTSLPISLWAKTQSFLFPTRSSLVKEPEALASAAAFPSAAKRELTPPGPACQQLFFSNPEVFFRSAPRGFFPGAEAGTYPDPLSLSTAFFCFFQKTSSPRRTRPLGPARLSETFRPAAARTGYAPPRRLCQRLFIFFLIFFFTPGNAPLTSGV